MLPENNFSIKKIYNISKINSYLICSSLKIDKLVEEKCFEIGDDIFIKAYLTAKNEGFYFTSFPDEGNLNLNNVSIPSFVESDIELVISNLGGHKIQERNIKTPDFYLNNILLEFKSLQNESLENKERQKNIAEIFFDTPDYSIDIDPIQNFNELTSIYHKKIKNTIKEHFKKASKQIKEFKREIQNGENSGIVLFNTGYFSLPHQLLKKLVEDILKNETETIEFAFIFTQIAQTNGWNLITTMQQDWVGNIPSGLNIKEFEIEFSKLIDLKMNGVFSEENAGSNLKFQKPISFEINDKIFYWNPGQISFFK
ncbi:hypothetical protein [Flavobacterium columnare]|nr:hypothetical protein [Flavobacterium columnare]QOG60066.1 hypothetical protein HUE30_08170 [Flavobacterium columnare]QOG62786.1 hypothetical protein HUE31_08170 [Flavobacterium columnare]QOG65510.1 hypothetical protein HUE32_08180 [Flavobacterium columnare]QOG79119.1 hypothetical protein HUE37_08175 [Flavobacterium columnare]